MVVAVFTPQESANETNWFFFFLSREPAHQLSSACTLVPCNNIIVLNYCTSTSLNYSLHESYNLYFILFLFFVLFWTVVPSTESIWMNNKLSILLILKHVGYISSHRKLSIGATGQVNLTPKLYSARWLYYLSKKASSTKTLNKKIKHTLLIQAFGANNIYYVISN